ncbi:hypothetical protein [Streptomyces fructofermentans]|nr:hypothetical protein [Streptomyces fructofermentans]
MAIPPTRVAQREAGQEWLLSHSDHPADLLAAWDVDTLGPLATDRHWRVGEAPLALSMDAMTRIGSRRCGPVLADVPNLVTWWLLPPDLGDELADLRQITIHPIGWELRAPAAVHPIRGRVWLGTLDGSGQLTDPVLLGAALGPGGGPRIPAEALG